MYYMVIYDGKIIDAIPELVHVRTQIAHNELILCQSELAEGILSYDSQSIWFVPELIKENIRNYPTVSLEEIDESKYKLIRESLDKNNEIEYPDSEPPISSKPDDPDLVLECVRDSKINEMSNICNKKILSGFNMCLDDGLEYHFDFTLEEQTNLMYAQLCIDNGATEIPYHASDKPCRFFTAEEMQNIIDTGMNMRIYETTYFNSLKLYIKSMKTIEEIQSVYYGIDIPEEFQSEVMTDIKNRKLG